MLNNLGPFWNKIGRIAEGTDTRQYIVRHEPEHQSGKKSQQHDTREEKDDRAAVSIDSLILFLQSALPDNETAIQPSPPPQQQETRAAPADPHAAQAAKAASAYASAGGNKIPRNTPAPQQPTSAQATSTPELSQDDIRTIQILINDLEDLKNRGFQSLPIQEGRNFLDSLVQAIRHARNT